MTGVMLEWRKANGHSRLYLSMMKSARLGFWGGSGFGVFQRRRKKEKE